MKIFKKILIANRGEIAVRIIKSAKKLGISTVAIYSEVDSNSLHISKADENYCLGHSNLSETYLNIKKIIDIAKIANCDAIHPGYGFLAENPEFVKACEQEKIVFIGPNSNSIKLMGNKIEARKYAMNTKIPVVAGQVGKGDELIKKAENISFPILVKAAAGGGGKGMRIVHDKSELKASIEATSREAKAYFDDGTVFIEKYLESPRHIEVQIIGDNFGNVIHLYERECSIQRRYQKIIEEAPSPTVTDDLRTKICDAAVRIAENIGYNNAGTVEFLVDKNMDFYFLEMNTRVQVEHPVSEMITGVDIVSEQILISAGNPLRFKQDEISINGHAIECRIYAENPLNSFLPSPGEMQLYIEPNDKNIRIDTGIGSKTEIKSNFDPMISKLIVWEEDRDIAIRKMINTLHKYSIHGIETNILYLTYILKDSLFISNKISTKYCDSETQNIINRINEDRKKTEIEIPILAYLLFSLNQNIDETANVWEKIGFWRNIISVDIEFEKKMYNIELKKRNDNVFELDFNNKKHEALIKNINENSIDLLLNNSSHYLTFSNDNNFNITVEYNNHKFKLRRNDFMNDDFIYESDSQTNESGNNVSSPMPGKIIKINVSEGDKVKKGDVLLIVEAMKMENSISSPRDAIVKKINAKINQNIMSGQIIIELKGLRPI